MTYSHLPCEWLEVKWLNLTTADGFRRGPFGGNLKKSFFVPEGYAVYEQYAPINDDCTNFRYFVDEKKYNEMSSFWVNGGDFLISCSGTMGRITQVPDRAPSGVINQALLRIRFSNVAMHPRYFLRLFRSPQFQERILSKSGGGAIQNLAAVKQLKEILVPLPPLAEQKAIAQKLDTLLAQVETTKARLDRIPEILKRFRQSVLAAAVSGKLTEEWRGIASSTSETWMITSVGMVAGVATGKTPKRSISEYWNNGNVPWLTSAATGKPFTYEAEQFVTMRAVEQCTLKIFPAGSLLLAMYGEGKTRGQVTEIMLAATCNQACAVVLADTSKINVTFLKIRLQENYEETRKSAAGGAQPNLNLQKVRDIPIDLPPLEEQTQIVKQVETLFAHADAIDKQVQATQARIDSLTQSILAKAFRGELTADWRAANPKFISGENSAESLLLKIKAEREARKPTRKTKKKA